MFLGGGRKGGQAVLGVALFSRDDSHPTTRLPNSSSSSFCSSQKPPSANISETAGVKTTRKILNIKVLSHYCTVAWVTRPERPKGMKDIIKQARKGLDF